MKSSPKAPASAAGIVAAKTYQAIRWSGPEIERLPTERSQAFV
jgi:hypothetical protein